MLVADVAGLVGAEYARVRTRLLAIPSGHAPALARIASPALMRDALERVITEALEELTQA